MKLILSVDDRIAAQASKVAQAMGKNLNQVVRDYVEHLAGLQQLEAELDEFEVSAMNSPGRRNGWRFDRDEVDRFAERS